MTTERRRFIVKASGAMAAVAAARIVDAPNVIAQPKVQWRMSTAWPPVLDNLQGAARQLAKVVEEMSGGRFRIEVFPGGQIMPPLRPARSRQIESLSPATILAMRRAREGVSYAGARQT